MATIEDCSLDVRVQFKDGWGGPAVVVGRRMKNRIEGYLAVSIGEGMAEQTGPDIVEVRFETPHGINGKIVAISCRPERLMLF